MVVVVVVVVLVVVVVVVVAIDGKAVALTVVVCSLFAPDPSGKSIPPEPADSVVCGTSSVSAPASLVTLTLPPSLRTQYSLYSLTREYLNTTVPSKSSGALQVASMDVFRSCGVVQFNTMIDSDNSTKSESFRNIRLAQGTPVPRKNGYSRD